jgi:hypothetical protein
MNQLMPLPIAVVDHQTCPFCKTNLSGQQLFDNLIEPEEDRIGIPKIMVRCLVCKERIEWQMRCN